MTRVSLFVIRLPDDFYTKIRIGEIFEGKMLVYTYMYCMAIFKYFWPVGKFCCHSVCFFPFWYVVPRKIWQA
jgi:hypothetical protein